MPRAYFGPPSYRGRHPTWGFPPVVWRRASQPASEHSGAPPLGRLRLAACLCALTGFVALAAAGSEAWRYVLLLRGRTEVLSGAAVVASDRLVGLASLTAVVLGLATVVVVLPLLVRLHGLAAFRAGLEPARSSASVVARLVVPGWNVFGAGVVMGEVDGVLADPTSRSRPRLSWLVVASWVAWAVNSVLVLITLIKAFGTSEQAVADTVELHIFVDVSAASVALLAALVLRCFRRLLQPPGAGRGSTWVVRPPEPTRSVHRTEGSDPAPVLLAPPSGNSPAVRDGQPAMLNTAPGSEAAGPAASQATVSASVPGDQPDAAADPDPTTVTPIP